MCFQHNLFWQQIEEDVWVGNTLDGPYNDFESNAENEIREGARKKARLGFTLMLFMALSPAAAFLIQDFVPTDVVLLLFIIFLAIGFLGTVLAVYFGKGSSLFFQCLDILKQLAPPDPIIIGRSAVVDKAPVYGVVKWGSNVIMFVALYQPERTFDKKMRVPRTIWRWEYKLQIAGIRLARREGTYTIPTGDDEYHTGEGVLYSLIVSAGYKFPILRIYSSEQLNEIVSFLGSEVSGYGSGHRMDDE